MFNIVLFQPEIPPNTGNLIRLCSNMGSQLHLIKPIAFDMDDKKLRRAGLDYREWVSVKIHESLEAFYSFELPKRLFACSTRGQKNYAEVAYEANDYLMFGPETRGLPQKFLDSLENDQIIRIPMKPNNRSINLANAVSIIAFEAWRQHNFLLEN